MKRILLHSLWPLLAAGVVLLSSCDQPPGGSGRVRPQLIRSATRITYPEGLHPQLPMAAGEQIRVRSLLNVRASMHFGDFIWDEMGVPPGPIRIRIDLARQMLSVFRGGDEIGTAVILYGTDNTPTPIGDFPVLERAKHHRSTLYDAEMPYMLRLTNDGVAIHASDVRQGHATHGCIGIPADFAARLFDQVRRGDMVVILPPETSNRI